jgi:hypothetical protein
MARTRQHKSRRLVGLAIGVIGILAALLLLVNRQYVTDQVSVWQYQPSSDVVALAERSSMSGMGTFYFYASHPQLQNAEQFNATCERKEEATAILGCYNGQYIYIYNISDAKLDGIREVTAAHEMLHAAYDRLSEQEKQKIGELIEAEFESLKEDEELAERLAFYERTEPGERINELHSIIGTEVAAISSELEAYYAKYFDDRSQVVALYDQYADVFQSLQERSDQLSQRLTELGDAIEAESAQYNKDVTQFNRDVEAFNQRAENGEFSSQAEFDSARATLLARGDVLEANRQQVNDKVAEYERLRAELIGIASQSEALNRSIDSSLAPAPSL